MAETIRIEAELDRIPDDEAGARAWCHRNGCQYLGNPADGGRRAWCPWAISYVRDALGVAQTRSGERVLVWAEDVGDERS